jgi:RHS repeat-associated protein
LKSVSSSAATTEYTSYNALGKILTSVHTISGYTPPLTISYLWRPSGALYSEVYPSGWTVVYDVDDAGRTTKAYGEGTTYADLIGYTADGRMTQMKLGNNLWETKTYLPPGTNSTTYMLGTVQGVGDRLRLDYSFAEGANNGNVMQQQIQWPNHSTMVQSYTYDPLNRLLTANETGGFSRTYGYDQYGNRWVSSSSGLAHTDTREPISSSQINPANNRLSMAGVSYDLNSGNQTAFGSLSLTYDAESRTTSYSGNGSGIYAYDGDGRRVKKVAGTTTTYYLYDALGRMAAEYSNQTPSSPGVSYLFTDMLGSTRAITSSTGALTECYDYLPFGRMLSASDNSRGNCFPSDPDAQPAATTTAAEQKFTGKERDAETGLDYFGARYYSGALERFLTPDFTKDKVVVPVPYADLYNPQSLNLYSYVLNNPITFEDKTGHAKGSSNYVELGQGWAMRIDGSRDPDHVNVAFQKGGQSIKYKIINGELVPQNEKIVVPNKIFEKGLSILEKRGKFDLALRKGAFGSGFGRTANRVLIAMQLIGIATDAYELYQINKDERDTGFHLGFMNEVIITDLKKFSEYMGPGSQIRYEGHLFELNDNMRWFTSWGAELIQDRQGHMKIIYPSA